MVTLKESDAFVPQCMYWDHSNRSSWSDYGCQRVVNDEKSHATCNCNHTTNYAVLMQIKPGPPSTTGKVHAKTLEILTIIGCSFSIFALISGLLIFAIFRHAVLSNERNVVHCHLMIAMLFAISMFLLSNNVQKNAVFCKTIAILLHYAYLATFCWMLVEGIHLYRLIVIVYGNERNLKWLYIIVGWVVPLPIVCISAGIRHTHYGQNGSCWLSTDDGFSWAFVGPVILIITLNIIVLAIVMKTIITLSNLDSENANIAKIRSGLKTAFMLFPMLGITWIFGLLANYSIIFAYLFTILNSVEGVWFVFVCCILNTEVREAVLLTWERKRNANRVGNDASTEDTGYEMRQSTRTQVQVHVHVHTQVEVQPAHESENVKTLEK
ncbi:adhesion G-protein coupled receptor D1-like [Amphiura filiformis]|uniref:adhesion G-protein coupled receptor D1-like n=1 Tax=Amphiura filiformis TaxID=82378 RepID=UPI003B21DCA0